MRSHLEPSELGTKAYWDEAYKREITNHSQDASDEGTIWFDDSGAEEKVIKRLESLEEQALLRKEDEKTEDGDGLRPASRILDLGTGNGHMIFALEEEGWMGDMVGVDYSDASVQLARQIAAQKNQDASRHLSLRFEKWDILNEQPASWLADGFDAVLDKGTFDAISLSDETDARGRRICEYYCEKITPLIKKGSFFIITSCNWTKEELLHWFVFPNGELHFFDEAKYPTFTFGGHQGQSVCTLVFQRR
ncbi:methyltransferase-like protein-like protein 10 [Delphinella strobiligena]|nr:methyltransferase-like protein-like protein 10 [Delphinella strobiligena]